MKKKIIFGFLFGVLLFRLVSPLTNFEINQIGCSAFEIEKAKIIGTEIPKQIPYGNELFNIYIGEEVLGYIEITDSIISDFGCVENENETYRVYIKDYSVLGSFGETADPFEMLQDKLKSKEIEIKGIGFSKKTKMFFTKIGLKIFGWFN